jgi:hypothetical protein
VYAGDQLRLTGRYTKSGVSTVTLTGTAGLSPVTLQEQIYFFADTSRSFSAVARYWGSQKIQSVLDLIAATGEKKELVDQVVALSIRYSVLTPYTAFLVVEPTTTIGGTAVETDPARVLTYALGQNYPNPFNPSTTISFQLAQPSHVTLTVYDALGREVAVLVNGIMSAGSHDARWDAHNAPSGVYYYVLRAGGFTAAHSMVLLK